LVVGGLGEVKSVGFKAFANCTALKAAWVFSVKEFGAYAFYGCKSLRTLDLLEVQTIGNYAFAGCAGLICAFFSEGLSSVGSNAFSKVYFTEDGSALSAIAANLRGHTFAGASTNLKLIA
jgi:hypothetical protein